MTIPEPAFVVRRAAPADADAMLALWQEAADLLTRSDSRYHLSPNAASCWKADLLDWLQQANTAVFVAESASRPGHILGYIVGSIATNLPTLAPNQYGYVSDLAVDAHGKAGGIGRGLFDALKSWFRTHHVSHVEARVPTRHAVAQAFWRALGASELFEQMWLKLDQ